MKPLVALIAALLVPAASAKSTIDALSLLSKISAKYAAASSYHIEAVQERTISNDLERNWEKELLTAIVSSGGRYRFEGRSSHGSAIFVSDGETRWDYHLDAHLYTQASASAPAENRIITMEEMPARQAKDLINAAVQLPSRVKSATLLRDQKIELSGQRIKCHVIHLSENDFRRKRAEFKTDETIWIDASRNVIVRIRQISDTYSMLPPSGAHIPILIDETTNYPVVEFGEQEPRASFTFSPPADAKLVTAFPEPMMHAAQPHPAALVGKPVPDVQFKATDGKLANLSAYRGKPVFIEFWATWCEPCIELMPDLKRLYADTLGSVTWISIDSDEDPDSATIYLKQEKIPWANYHDEDGSLGKAFGREAIPLGVLIDPDGKVTFYKSGYDIADLRAAMAKLLPQLGAVKSQETDTK
ncbi:MAG TPA: redoxin family protein [Terriglobales bacterium]|nr:redoxin family protein [Terriglobales bacterium]